MSSDLVRSIVDRNRYMTLATADADGHPWAGARLMGRKTYEEKSSFWPESDDRYAQPMNDIPRIVFSKTLDDSDAG